MPGEGPLRTQFRGEDRFWHRDIVVAGIREHTMKPEKMILLAIGAAVLVAPAAASAQQY
jgi:hypothetical protein